MRMMETERIDQLMKEAVPIMEQTDEPVVLTDLTGYQVTCCECAGRRCVAGARYRFRPTHLRKRVCGYDAGEHRERGADGCL